MSYDVLGIYGNQGRRKGKGRRDEVPSFGEILDAGKRAMPHVKAGMAKGKEVASTTMKGLGIAASFVREKAKGAYARYKEGKTRRAFKKKGLEVY